MALVYRFFKQGDDLTEGNTTAETACATKATIPAHLLQPGSRVHGRALGKVTNQHSTDTLAARMRIGAKGTITGTVLADVAAYDAATNDAVELSFDMVVEAKGSPTPATPTSEFHSSGLGWRTGGSDKRTYVFDDQTLETRADIDVAVTSQWSVADVANDFTLKSLEVWVEDATPAS